MSKFTALEIANFYVQLVRDLPDTIITNRQLNDLCCYAQDWCTSKLGYLLFDDRMYVYTSGAVIPSVYHAYKVCGNNPIAEPLDSFDESRLSTDELNLLTNVFLTYEKSATLVAYGLYKMQINSTPENTLVYA